MGALWSFYGSECDSNTYSHNYGNLTKAYLLNRFCKQKSLRFGNCSFFKGIIIQKKKLTVCPRPHSPLLRRSRQLLVQL